MMSMNLQDQGRVQDRVRGAPEGLPRGPVSMVDHLLVGPRKMVMVEAGGFLVMVPPVHGGWGVGSPDFVGN
jgi:hypothetical protein